MDIKNQAQDEKVKRLLEMLQIDQAKISRKNRPTFIVRHDDRLFKMKPELFNSQFSTDFCEEFENQIQMIQVDSVMDLAEKLRKYNVNVSDSLVVYYESAENRESEAHRSAIRLLRDDSYNPMLVVRDPKLASQLQMKPGSFYTYFKPSFANGLKE